MRPPKIIQGGMGVAISDWKLARAVATQGQLGVVSGTGIAFILISRLMEGDIGGHTRRALDHFPFQDPVRRVIDTYYRSDTPDRRSGYKIPPMWTLHPSPWLMEVTVLANFVEVFLAKEGHEQPIGINLLEKLQLPTLASLYGAMLAKVDVVTMGAGIPTQIPGILDQLAGHEPTSYRLDVRGSSTGDDFRIHFDPSAVFPDVAQVVGPLSRPKFLPIVSSWALAKALIKRATGKVDGFIVELPVAGGHNAPPRDASQRDDAGEPVYGDKDTIDLEKVRQLGLPFWLAGGYDTPEGLQHALGAGACGIQVGTAFAYCEESGMDPAIKQRVLRQVLDGKIRVRTDPVVSPTGFPFKVAQVPGTMSDSEVYRNRTRWCDAGMMRQLYKREDGTVGFRCPSEPEKQFLGKGGDPEDVSGRGCLCNNLRAAAGYPQRRKNGYLEPPLVTAGDGLVDLGRFIKPGTDSYTARDVLESLHEFASA